MHDAKQHAIERPEDKPAHVISAAINSNFGSNPKGLSIEHLNKVRRAIYRNECSKVGIPLKDKLHGGTIMLDFKKAVISCVNALFV